MSITTGMFDNVSMLRKGLDAAWLKQEVIANNIANNDVPNFKASHVEFESMFAAALDDSAFTAKRTRAKHMAFGAADAQDVQAMVMKNADNTSMRMDGNNVDIEKENTEMLKAQIFYNSVAAKVTGEFSRLRIAITGG